MHTLYDYGASGNCLKVRLALGLVGASYERIAVDIFAGETMTDAFAILNPLRETPVLVTEAGDGITQSTAILTYLAEGTSWSPADPLGRARVAQWLAFEQERVMVGIGGTRFRAITGRERADPAGAVARRALGRDALRVLDAHLARQTFLVGSAPTIADVAVYGYAHVADEAGIPLAPFRAVRSWLDRLEAVDGFVNDLVPYPPNAWPGAGRSIYDPPP